MTTPFTPANNKHLSRLQPASPSCSSPSVHLPATPFLTKLGYGTGVSVFLYQRSPAGDRFRSPWAVKKVNKRHAMSQFGQRLEEEAKVLKTLSHPNIIGYRAFNKKDDGTHALVMEDGHKSLFDIIEERNEAEEGPFPANIIEDVIMWCAKALHYLHTEKSIMHGDIKSGNILVVGEFENVKICDFGVTLPLNSEGKVSNPDTKYVGTEAWSPMEVIKEEEVNNKADIFAFGLVVYEMLALHSPHVDKLMVPDSDDEDDDIDDSVCEEAFRAALGTRPPLPDSSQLDQSYRTVLEIFFAATNEDPEKRPSAAEILDLLENKEDNDDSILCVNMVQGDQTASAV
eukprot:GFUD01010367.1.p1 GENE.GFUD01010367.1~~GFUD01010367.1.p1  ORF type:complete len:343 (+),score=130.20 GFUD01010367.1:59-1087(+)